MTPTEVTERPISEDTAESSGPAVRMMRLERHMSQRMLAARSGVEPSTISRLERGVTSTTTLTVLTRLAEGLGCTPDDLLLLGRSAPAAPASDGGGVSLPELQRALIGTSIDDRMPLRVPPDQVAAQIDLVRQLRTSGHYRRAAAAAGQCLPDAHADAPKWRDRAQWNRQLTHVCFDAALSARLVGDLGTAWIAAERAQEAAALTRRPVFVAGAAFARTYVGLGRVPPQRALQIAEAYSSTARPESPELAALLGMLHLGAALAGSRMHTDPVGRDRHLDESERLAPLARGEADPFALHFGHDTIWQWRLNMALEAGDQAAAADALARIRLERISDTHHRAAYYIDLARLYAASQRWDHAVNLLAHADRTAAEFVAYDPAARRLREYLGHCELNEASAAQLRLLDRHAAP